MSYYKYYDTPDGQDLVKKLGYTTKMAGGLGLVLATYDVSLYSHPKGFGPIAGRYLYWTGPLIGMAAAYTSATCISTQMREKDDSWNHVLGGIAAGCVAGAWQKNYLTGFVSCLAFSAAAVLKKHSIQDGWEFFPGFQTPVYSSVWVTKTDYTLQKDDLPKSWTTKPNEV